MPRPSRPREALLDAGSALLYRQGYNATGVQQITDAAGVPKGSFYNYFRSKERFALEALKAYLDQACGDVEDALLHGQGDARQRVEALLDRWIERAEANARRGCLAGNLGQELALENALFQAPVEAGFRRMEAYIIFALQQGVLHGSIKSSLDIHETASFILNSYQGSLLRCKTTGSTQPLHQLRRLLPMLIFKSA